MVYDALFPANFVERVVLHGSETKKQDVVLVDMNGADGVQMP